MPADGHPVVGHAEHVSELHDLLLVQIARGRAGDVRHVGRTGETINLASRICGVTTELARTEIVHVRENPERLIIDAEFADELARLGPGRGEGQPNVDPRNVARQQQDALGLELVERIERLELLGSSGKLGSKRRRIAAHVHVDQMAGDDLQMKMARFNVLRRNLDCGDIPFPPQPRGGVIADIAHDRDRTFALRRLDLCKQIADDRRQLGTLGPGEVDRRDARLHARVSKRTWLRPDRALGLDLRSRSARLLLDVASLDLFAAWGQRGSSLRLGRGGTRIGRQKRADDSQQVSGLVRHELPPARVLPRSP